MDTELTEEPHVRNEATLVENWRLKVLLEAGYDPFLAEQVAASDADLHVATALVSQGCSPRLAAQILV